MKKPIPSSKKNFSRIFSASNVLGKKSELFEPGELTDAPDEESYIRRLNTLLAAQEIKIGIRPPDDFASAIRADGTLNRHAEISAFGRWLLLDGMPGKKLRGGKQINPSLFLRTVAVAIAELRAQEARRLAKKEKAAASKNHITATLLARQWPRLLDEQPETKDFPARIRSMKILLPEYLQHLKSGSFSHSGKVILRSPEIKAVLAAISGKSSSSSGTRPSHSIFIPTTAPAALAMPLAPASLSDFDIELGYSSPDMEAEYRNLPAGSAPASFLRYKPTPLNSSSATLKMRKDRSNRIVLQPLLSIRENFTHKALIDRMAILVNTRKVTLRTDVKKLIQTEPDIITFVHDLTLADSESKTDWRALLPDLDMGKKTGQHFAIMIQEPDPTSLSEILQLLEKSFGLDGGVELYLLELAIDLYPVAEKTPEERLILREQMVGLLQRHHWAANSAMNDPEQLVPRYSDARQVYGKNPGPRYFFAHKKGAHINSDFQITNPEVVSRILNANAGNNLMLNATIYKGAANAPLLINIQHKTSDRRNKDKGTQIILPDIERRARIELTITGQNKFKEFNLSMVEDLTRVSFRSLRKNLLHFRLGTALKEQQRFDDAVTLMKTRFRWRIRPA